MNDIQSIEYLICFMLLDTDLIKKHDDKIVIEINQSLEKGEIENATEFDQILFQNECCFLGKIMQ